MPKDRTNMVSLLDIGTLLGSTEKIAEMGDGFSEITEDWGPNTASKQYVNMKNASNSVKGYAFSMSPARDDLTDEMQTAIDTLFKIFPTGEACETSYYRFLSESVLCHHAAEHAVLRHHHGHGCGNRCEPGKPSVLISTSML